MKCDELEEWYAGQFSPSARVYGAYDVTESIAELKAKLDKAIAERDGNQVCIDALKQKLENVQASMYCDVVDANMENRRLRRALWIARAERANDKARMFYFAYTCEVKLNIDGYSNKEKGHARMCTARWWRLTWLKVERKCKAKAEEYK